MRTRWFIAPALALGLAWVAPRGDAQDACRPEIAEMDKYSYLRALSLDLRGVVPTMEEYESLEGVDDVPEALINEWLASDEHAARVARHHRTQLWPNITNVRIIHFQRNISERDRDADLWWRDGVSSQLRGGRVGCLDEPASYDGDGNLIFQETPDGVRREGYEMVRPYWDPSVELKVCALDAQTQELSTMTGRPCSSRETNADSGCGCGPNLRWCSTSAVVNRVTRAMADDVERRIMANVQNGEPYQELFTGRRAFVNGPLSFFWKNLAYVYDRVPLVPEAVDVDLLPEIEFTAEDEWQEIELPASHSGILTSPLFLLRFQTNRARASRFFDRFLCRPFQPPPGGIPLDDEVAALQPDVQQRPGCNYCHAILEPAAAHWGRWTQQGGGFLSTDLFPAFDPSCADCGRGAEACSETCSLHYITRAVSPEEEEYLGMLRGFQFLRREHEGFVDDGPSRLVREGLVDGSLTSCTSVRAVEWLLAREPSPQEADWMDSITTRFVGTGLAYPELVRSIVTSDTYRRVR